MQAFPTPKSWKSRSCRFGPTYVQGLDLLGGNLFSTTGILLPLVKRVKRELPDKDIWSWTGYTWEEMMLETPDKLELLSLIDILVDGRYDKSKRNLMLQFRGSSNQRIIDVQKSLKEGKSRHLGQAQ